MILWWTLLVCRWTGSTDRGLEGVKTSVGGVALGSSNPSFPSFKNSAPDAGLILPPEHCLCTGIRSSGHKAKVATGGEGTGAAHTLAGFVLL